MFDRTAGLAILTSLLTWQVATPLQANDVYFEGHPGWATSGMAREVRLPLPVAAEPGRVLAVDRRPTAGLHQPWEVVEPGPGPGGWGLQAGHVGSVPAASWQRPVRLPPTQPRLSSPGPHQGAGPAPGQLADGTWREDGRYIIINLNGQQVRLVKEPQTSNLESVQHQTEQTGGTLYGRLLNHGRPLANCQVIIRPMTKSFSGYAFKRAVQPIRTTTDVQGVYRFENVPPGPYKLSWLPQGTNQWIRRIAMRPDIAVQAQETTQVKDILVALRTIN